MCNELRRRCSLSRIPGLSLLLLGLLSWAGPGAASGQEPESLRLDLPGRLVSAAPTGQGRLWLLSEDQNSPRLHLFVAGKGPRLLLDVLPLPGTVEEVASADCDGDGSPEAVALAPEAWWWIRGNVGSLELVKVNPEGLSGGRWTGPARRGIVAPSSAHPPAMAEPGTLRVLAEDAGGFAVRARVPLPVSAEREPWGVRLSSPRLRPIPGGWLGWKEEEGRRIPVVRITEEGEAWELVLAFPGSEQIDSAAPLVLDGDPHLLVQSMTGFGPMADKRFRLYPLTAPSGATVPPILEERLEINVWQNAEAVVRDVDDDGKEDLLLLAPPGMGDGRLAIWTFRRRPGGGFEAPRKSVRGLEGASFVAEHDLTGDGISDLVLLEGRSAAVYPGGSGPGDFVEVAPVRGTVDLSRNGKDGSEEASGEGRSYPTGRTVADVDGDGVAEVIFWRSDDEGSTLLVVSFADR